MSWLGGYKSKPGTNAEDARELKRQQLEANRLERLKRAQNRAELNKRLQAAEQARQEANQAAQDLLNLDPDIFSGSPEDIDIDLAILNDSSDKIIMNFDQENGADGDKAIEKVSNLSCPYNKNDVEFWFMTLESQLELIEVKSQWLKRMALLRVLPIEVQEEVKALLMIPKASAGTDIYYRIKNELLDLFGSKPEDAYDRACSRVMTGKPSQLGKALIADLCKCAKKLEGCCCDRIIWGMFRKSLPVVVRNHISDLRFNSTTYKDVFAKADQVWDSNRSSEPLPNRQVASTTSDSSPEVAAVQGKNQGQRKNKNKNGVQSSGQNSQSNQSGQSGQSGQNGQKGQNKPEPKPAVNEEKLCRIHAKWKNNATFCAAPWACKMKNVWKAPQ